MMSDRPVLEFACEVVRGGAEYANIQPDRAIAALVEDLVYGDTERCGLRECISRDDLESVNWKELVEDLKEE